MKEIKLVGGDTIEEAVQLLKNSELDGESAYCFFNGVKLCSDGITIDSAYIKICGCTKAEFDENLRKEVEEAKKRLETSKKRAKENIPYQISRGKSLIHPFRHERWASFVQAETESDYAGILVENVIEVMKGIDEGKTTEQLHQIFNEQGHSGRSAWLARCYIMEFSKNGYPFFKETHFGEWTVQECEWIEKIVEDNKKFAGEQLSDNEILADIKKIKESVEKKPKEIQRNKIVMGEVF